MTRICRMKLSVYWEYVEWNLNLVYANKIQNFSNIWNLHRKFNSEENTEWNRPYAENTLNARIFEYGISANGKSKSKIL